VFNIIYLLPLNSSFNSHCLPPFKMLKLYRGLKLFGREIIFEEFQPMWSRYLNVTDRQTDRQTDGQHTIAIQHFALKCIAQ